MATTEPPVHHEESLAEAAGGAVDKLADLLREYIALARIEVGGELEATAKRVLWWAAGLLAGFVALILAVIGVFALAGALISSTGWRLVILAILCAIGAFALVLRGVQTPRPKALASDAAPTPKLPMH